MTTLLVAISGGHLAQLRLLGGRLVKDRVVWITDDTPQSRSLLVGETVVTVPTRPPRDWAGVLHDSRIVMRTMSQYRVRQVISTGSQVALSAYIGATMSRIPFAYIESATRVTSLSTTGRVLDRLPGAVRFVQYPTAVKRRWRHQISVFDGFEIEPAPVLPKIRRIVVTVGGNSEYTFPRMIERLRQVIPDGVDILWQLGANSSEGLPGRTVASLPSDELADEMRKADVVVGHAGTGTALAALLAGKTPLLVPRSVHQGEHIDSHQDDLAQYLRSRGLAVVHSPDQLSLTDLVAAAKTRVIRTENPEAVDLFERVKLPAEQMKPRNR